MLLSLEQRSRMATNGHIVTVFGGAGFLGRRIVRHLRDREFAVRIASRHPDRGHSQLGRDNPQLRSVYADIHDERSVADALAGAYAVVNTVSLYVEHRQETFHSVHVESAERVAAQAHRAGVKQLVHISGIGADPASQSPYIRTRGEGELVVAAAFADAHIIRPAVMFGPDDAFLTTILNLLRRLPIYPMFGGGLMRLQPAYVEDVAERLLGSSSEPRRNRGSSSAVALAPTLTRNLSESSRAKLALRPSSFQSRLPFGAHWHGVPKYSRTHFSRVIRWS
jgi:uncharacterized protein YbjT (DUF2867 family)